MIKHLLVTVTNFANGNPPEFESIVIVDDKFERVQMKIDKENENNPDYKTTIINWITI